MNNKTIKIVDYSILADEELLNLLFIKKDRLSRQVVDEFIKRGERFIKPLRKIIEEINNWQGDDNQFWAVIHAVFILGAIGGEKIINPLIMSLRYSDIYSCDWVFEALPSMFSKIGKPAFEPLKKIVLDSSNGWFVRMVALESLSAIVINEPYLENEIFNFVASILGDSNEDRQLRGTAGSILLNFREKKYQKRLLAFAAEEDIIKEQDDYYIASFDQECVLKELSSEKRYLNDYTTKWLDFYNDEEITKRQKRWKQENSIWYRLPLIRNIIFKFQYMKIEREMKKKEGFKNK